MCGEKSRNVEKCRVLKISDGFSNGGVLRCLGLAGGVRSCLGLAGGGLWRCFGLVGGCKGVLGWEELFLAGSHQ